MVGSIGPRSKGCLTCRRRKVKCDETRPQCQRCQKANTLCDGYQRDMKWVDEAPRLSQSHSRAQSKSRAQKGHVRTSGTPESSEGSHRPDIAPIIGLSAFQDRIYVSFLFARLFDGGPNAEGYTYQTWISSTNKAEPTNVAYVALQCLAAAFFGRLHGNSARIMSQGSQLYGQALRKLRANIDDPATSHDQVNVSATMALSLYEMVAYDNEYGWIRHAGGIGCLLEMMGPERVQEYPAHGYFLLSRLMIIFEALLTRRRTFLATMPWKTLPWKLHPETQSPYHNVVSSLANIDCLLEDRIAIDNAISAGFDVTAQTTALLQKTTSQLQTLVRWRWDWEIRNGPAAFEVVVDPLSSLAVDEQRNPLWDTVIYYRTITLAEEIQIYNTVMLSLLYFWKQIQGGGASFAPALSIWPEEQRPRSVNSLILPGRGEGQWAGAGVGVLDVAREICRSTEYHLLGQHENEGSFFLMFPLRLCVFSIILNQGPHNPYRNGLNELRWVVRILKMIANSSGFGVASRMVSVIPMTSMGEGSLQNIHTDERVERVARLERGVKDPAELHLKKQVVL